MKELENTNCFICGLPSKSLVEDSDKMVYSFSSKYYGTDFSPWNFIFYVHADCWEKMREFVIISKETLTS